MANHAGFKQDAMYLIRPDGSRCAGAHREQSISGSSQRSWSGLAYALRLNRLFGDGFSLWVAVCTSSKVGQAFSLRTGFSQSSRPKGGRGQDVQRGRKKRSLAPLRCPCNADHS